MCLAALLLCESLRACDVRQFAIPILTRNVGGIIRIKKPVKIAKSVGRLIAGLRDKRYVTHMRETCWLAVLSPHRINLVFDVLKTVGALEDLQNSCASCALS